MNLLKAIVSFVVLAMGGLEAGGLEQWRLDFSKFSNFKVNFSQSLNQQLLDQSQNTAAGYLEFEKPRSMKWVYEKPRQKVIEAKGDVLLIDGEPQSLAEGVRLEDIFSFMWGQPNRDLFTIEKNNAAHLELKVREGVKASVKKIRVTFGAKNIEAVEIEDQLGGTSRLEFTNWRFG